MASIPGRGGGRGGVAKNDDDLKPNDEKAWLKGVAHIVRFVFKPKIR